jgi:ribonuclease D
MKPAIQQTHHHNMAHRYMLYKNDLPADLKLGDVLAMDTEFMGLNVFRDRLCLFQIYEGSEGGKVHMVQFDKGNYAAPNLRKLLADPKREKIFYFARGDMRWIGHYLGTILENVYCLKIASRIARTYTQSHELEDISKHVIGQRISKDQQCTNWGAPELTHEQLDYACNDVLYLHAIKDKLNQMMDAERRKDIAYGLFRCLPALVRADLGGWGQEDIFSYHVPKPN